MTLIGLIRKLNTLSTVAVNPITKNELSLVEHINLLSYFRSNTFFNGLPSRYLCVSCCKTNLLDFNSSQSRKRCILSSITTRFNSVYCILSSLGRALISDGCFTKLNSLNIYDKTYLLNLQPVTTAGEQTRSKSSKKSSKGAEYDSDSDTDEETIEGTKVLSVHLQSLRTDGVLKKSLGMARNKMETAFYEGNIRVNGKKPMKKSHQLKIGDEVDLIRGVSPVNSELLRISRVEVLSVKESGDEEDDDHVTVKLRLSKSLFINNYETDPWKKGNTAG